MMKVEEIREHQQAFLNKEKQRKDPLTYIVEGVAIKVNPGVFPPATDTRLLAANIHARSGVRTLDMTTGSGAFSVIAGLQGASGIAVDINPLAVLNAEENFSRYKLAMRAVESDLFDKVPDEKFDQIYANGPFFEGDITDPLDFACYGARAFLEKLLGGTRAKLKPSGSLLIVLSVWSDLDFFGEVIGKNSLHSALRDSRKSDDGEREYHLYEVSI